MDYGMVAPGDDFAMADKTHQLRPTHHFDLVNLFNLLNVSRPPVQTLGDFITFINTDPSVTQPIGNIFVGAHSNAQGFIVLQMTAGQAEGSNSSYETIEKATLTGALAINNTVIGPTPAAHFFHFKGCSIGRNVALLNEWKLALGGQIQVTAPRFNHGLYTDQFNGVWEYMTYDFMVTSPTPIKDRDTLIQQFQNAKFTYVESGAVGPDGKLVADGPAIPPNMWDKWLPLALDPDKTGTVLALKEYEQEADFKVPAVDGLPFPVATIPVYSPFLAEKKTYNQKIDFKSTPVPVSTADRLAALQNYFLIDKENEKVDPHSRFTSAHPFPIYQRYGYPDLPSFMNGYTWTFVNKMGSSILQAFGRRYEYSIVIGLTSPNPGSQPSDNLMDNPLLVNFHPLNPSLASPITQLAVTDPRFFQTV